MSTQQRLAYVALVLSALLFGVGTAFAVFALRALTAFDLLAVEIGSATVTLWVALAVLGPRTTRRWPIYALLGLLEPALSFALYNSGLAQTSATHGALLESLDGLFVVILGTLLLRERLNVPSASRCCWASRALCWWRRPRAPTARIDPPGPATAWWCSGSSRRPSIRSRCAGLEARTRR
ncbi:DMT family transporter [Candidatus Nephthysia bennettiae]|uniref:DMT family transporter n=1 Tax=Candidatus Nephthysia bennettiae TaxID=3127016 RepID=A0A934KEZ6_9BACT|nr:DMT family transporter [Candidatus Dormibacteraeota bacterium]MBJ7613297.1 DMT family transporter [Candidatus Dormibacteraeota bacterium]